MSDTLHPLEPFEYLQLKDGTKIWFSEEPSETDASPDKIYLVSGISPEDAEFYVPPHFHPLTDEYLRCTAGQLYVTIDGVVVTLRPGDEEVKVPKGAVHSLSCPRGQYAEFQEREDPGPAKKRDFLRSLFAITEAPSSSLLQVLTLFYEDGDAFPAQGPKLLGKLMVYVVGGFFGSFLGLGKPKAKEA